MSDPDRSEVAGQNVMQRRRPSPRLSLCAEHGCYRFLGMTFEQFCPSEGIKGRCQFGPVPLFSQDCHRLVAVRVNLFETVSSSI